MSAQGEPTPAERVRELLERVNEALALEAEVEVVEDADHIRCVLHGEDMGLFIGATARPSTPCSTLRSKWQRTAGRLRREWRSMRPATASAAAPHWRAKPSRPRLMRSALRARSRWTR